MDIKNKLESKIEYKNDFKQKINQLNKEDTIKENIKFDLLNTKNQSNLEDEIPLIDDGIEDLNDQLKSSNQETKLNNDQINNELIKDKSINQNSLTDSNNINNEKNLVNQNKQTVGGLDQCHLQIINNLEEFKLNEDELVINDTTDQLDSVELNQADEQEEKERLIQQVIELRNTLDDLSNRINNVREQSFKLTNENNVLNQYVENLMAASSVFQSTSTPTTVKRKTPRK